MKPVHRKQFWLASIILYSLSTFLGSSDIAAQILIVHHPWDKVVHFIEYAILAWLALRYISVAGWKGGYWVTIAAPIILCAVIGGINELYQTRIPGRLASWSDQAANITGAAMAVGVNLIVFKGRKPPRLDSSLTRESNKL